MTKPSEILLQHTAKVMRFIYRNQQVSRIKISHALQLKPASVTHIINRLITDNKIIETGDEVRELTGSGRSRKVLTINPNFAYLIGLEFNMRGITIVVTNMLGTILDSDFIPHHHYHTADINQNIIQLILSILDKHPSENCLGIGMAIPGHFDNEQQKLITNNKSWTCFNLTKINKNISIPITLENNIECMALGEYLFDAQQSPDKFLFLHSGPGMFCSFFDSEHITTKNNYYIGEIGHSIVDINGQQCECGKFGCLQTYISDTWLIENAKFLFLHSQNTILKNLVNSAEDITLEVIINAYALGDSYIVEKINTGIRFLAVAIANTLIVYDSNKIYINSELLNRLNFKEQLIANITEQLQFIPTKTNLDIEVLPFNLYRGARGACALASHHFFVR